MNDAERLQKLEWQRDVIIGFQAQGILTWSAMQEAITVINDRIYLANKTGGAPNERSQAAF